MKLFEIKIIVDVYNSEVGEVIYQYYCIAKSFQKACDCFEGKLKKGQKIASVKLITEEGESGKLQLNSAKHLFIANGE